MKSIGQRFVEAGGAVKAKKGQSGPEVDLSDVDVKTLLTTSTGITPDTTREPGAVPLASRIPTLVDQVLASPTKSDPHTYMEETTYTNPAAETAEGGTYGEAALGFTARSSDVGKITAWLPVTDEALEDGEGLESLIDQRLGFMVRQRLELQMLVGNGTGVNLRGILNVAGIQTQAKGADTAAVAIRKGITKVRAPGYASPSLVVLNPTDGEEIDLAAAVDLQAPFVVGPTLWSVPRHETDALTLNTAVVGDFRNFCALKVKKGITLQVSNSHSTFFVEGKQAIRVTFRAAFPVYRPAAFVAVTGI